MSYRSCFWIICLLSFGVMLTLAAIGCGSSSNPPPANSNPSATVATSPPATPAATPPNPVPPISTPPLIAPSSTPGETPNVRDARPTPSPIVLDDGGLFGEDNATPQSPESAFDQGKIRTAGIRRIAGKHLILFTDLPEAPAVEELPQVFDLAVPEWCAYFNIDPATVADWQIVGCLMAEKNRFSGAGLFAGDLPDFPHGYHRGRQIWVYQQPSEYYARHLVLHEGTHAFMRSFLRGAGPPWFMEGMAEYLGTHRWADGKLRLAYMPRDKEEVPYWGRIKIIEDDFAANRGHSLDSVLEFGPKAHLRTEAYAWSWGAVTLLAEHPLSKQAFREMFSEVNLPAQAFAEKLKGKLSDAWPKLEEQWQLFVINLEYGYDVPANAVEYAEGRPVPATGADVTISATHSWQSSGYLLEAGKKYQITASGQYTIATQPQPWPCEPGGVTLRYYRGEPLGKLKGALRTDQSPAGGLSSLASWTAIGLAKEVTPDFSGVLYLSINEHPGEWSDNAGSLQVHIQPVP